MSTWGSKHVEEYSILWINNNQCIKGGECSTTRCDRLPSGENRIKLGVYHSLSGHFGEGRNTLCPCRESNQKSLGCPAPSLAIISTELSPLVSRMPHKTTLTDVLHDFPQPPQTVPEILLDIILYSLLSLSLPIIIHYFSFYLKLHSLNEWHCPYTSNRYIIFKIILYIVSLHSAS